MSKKKQQKPINNPAPTNQKHEQPVKQTISTPVNSDGLLNVFSRFGIYIFLVSFILIATVIYKDFLFGKYVFLFKDIGSDSYNGDFTKLTLLADYWKREGVPSWSFQQGMGQSIYPYWFDPFTFLLILLGKDSIANGMIYINVLQLIIGGLFFYLFLKTRQLSQYVAVLGGLLYAFCGYSVIGSTWQLTAFGLEIVYAPFLLFAIEKYISQRQWYFIPLAIGLISIHIPFNLYLYTILIIIYYTVRFNEENEWNFLKWFMGLFTIGVVSVLGVGMGAFMFGSNLIQMFESPRGSGEFAYTNTLTSQPVLAIADSLQRQTSFARLFSTNMVGHADAFRGWSNYMEAASVYAGIISLVAAPQVFHFANKKEKIVYGALAGLCLLVMLFPYFRYTFWLFTGDYYRTLGLFIAFVLLYFNAKAIHQIIVKKELNLWVLLGTIILLFLMIFVVIDGQNLNKSIRTAVVFLIIIYGGVLFLLSKNGLQNLGLIILLALTIGELIFISSTTVNRRSPATKQEITEAGDGFNDATIEAVKYIKNIDKSTFYRLDKDYASGTSIHASTNDSKVQDYYGTRSYNSFNQLNYIRFLKEMEQIPANDESFTRWTPGLANNAFLQSSSSVKYFLSKAPNSAYLIGRGFDSLTTFNDVKVWRNKYALPLGFCYDKYITQAEAKKLGTLYRTISTMQAAIVENDIKSLQKTVIDTTRNLDFALYQSFRDNLKKDTLQITKFSDNEITGKIEVNAPKLLYFSIPLDKGWKATVDGKETEIQRVHFGMMGILLDKGKHEVSLTFSQPYLGITKLISIASLALYGLLVGFFVMRERKKKE